MDEQPPLNSNRNFFIKMYAGDGIILPLPSSIGEVGMEYLFIWVFSISWSLLKFLFFPVRACLRPGLAPVQGQGSFRSGNRQVSDINSKN